MNSNNFYIILKNFFVVSSFAVLSACSNQIANKPDVKSLEINRFTLDQTNELGLKIFQLKSDKALIDDITKQLLTSNTDIILYDKNKKIYNIKSDEAKIEKGGKSLSLLGNVNLTKIDNDEFSVFSDRVEWKPSESLILFFGNVKGDINKTVIFSSSAIYDLEENFIDFKGITEFNVKSSSNSNPIFDINAQSALWNGNTGVFEFFSDSDSVTSTIFINQG